MSRNRASLVWGLLLAVLAAAVLPRPAAAQVQGTRKSPSPTYFLAFPFLYDGRYKGALEVFQSELRGAVRTLQQRWIDSICYNTMAGECQYRLGNYPAALEHYTAALRLYLQYPGWMVSVVWPDAIGPAMQVQGVPWGRSTRNVRVGRFPDHMQINFLLPGASNDPNVLQQGGRFQPPIYYTISAQEVVRCTCLSMMRRRQLMGPLVTYDPLTDEVMSVANRRQGPTNHWSEAWLDVLQGFAYSSAGKSVQAMETLKRSLLVQGQFDHPLAGMALLELGYLTLESGDFKQAAGYFEEATYSAGEFGDLTVVEEAFRGCWLAHSLGDDVAALDGPLAAAAGWARNRSRELQVSLMLLAAEGLAIRGQTAQATSLLNDAKTAIGRRELAVCELGSRLQYVTAITHYQRGAVAAGDEALGAAMRWQRDAAKWAFQIALADNLCTSNTSGRFTPRVAVSLYQTLLRDPDPTDWTRHPLESLSVMATPHLLQFDHWFEAAMEHAPDTAVEVADRVRRHRFLSTLPLGGRLLALRWLLEGPEDVLDNTARLQRQEILMRYPRYVEASQKARQLRDAIAQQRITGEALETQSDLAGKLAELAAVSDVQEATLREIAVRREPAEIVFPPLRKLKEVQQALEPGQLVLEFFDTSRGTHAWLFSREKSAQWKINNPEQVERALAALLKAMGNFDATREIQETQLADETWKRAARDVLDGLLKNSKVTFNAEFAELVVVPDGMLWYLPFELLPVGDVSEYRPLLSRTRIRYAPTLGLAVPDRQGRKPAADVALVLGKMYPTDTAATADGVLEEIRRGSSNVVPLRSTLMVPSPVVGAVVEGVVVWDDLHDTKGPFDWSPIPLDRNKGDGTLAAWMSLPWKETDFFILPGFHTAAESSLKGMPAVPGADLFLATTGLMAGGAKTIVISRWRTGGQTAVELTREFTQELPYASAAEAWQRAVQLVRQTPLDPAREPRVRPAPNSQPMQADHPFFWAGYMLVDTGTTPQKADQPAMPQPKGPAAKEADQAAK